MEVENVKNLHHKYEVFFQHKWKETNINGYLQ